MKKFLILILVLIPLFLSGCSDKYKTIQEYSSDMTNLRTKLGDYTFESVTTIKNSNEFYNSYMKAMKVKNPPKQTNKNQETNIYSKTYIKGKLWKTENSAIKNRLYTSGLIFDGENIYSYSKNSSDAVPIELGQNKKDDIASHAFVNPSLLLYYWKEFGSMSLGRKTKKNDFECHMVRYGKNGKDGEACISDKYGIAVYLKTSFPPYNEVRLNVTKINNIALSDYDLDLPAGVRKRTIEQVFRNMINMLKQKDN